MVTLKHDKALICRGVFKHLSQVSTRFLRDKCSNFVGAIYIGSRRMRAIPHSAISWMV